MALDIKGEPGVRIPFRNMYGIWFHLAGEGEEPELY